jgi:1-deoxy-D-xylulose-5-phosphate reductoisomerase
MLSLGVAAGKQGGAAPAVFNAANEQAVAMFLDGTLRFGEIAPSVRRAFDELSTLDGGSRDALMAADVAARRVVRNHASR